MNIKTNVLLQLGGKNIYCDVRNIDPRQIIAKKMTYKHCKNLSILSMKIKSQQILTYISYTITGGIRPRLHSNDEGSTSLSRHILRK